MREFKFRAWHPREGMNYIEDLYWFEEQGVHEMDDGYYKFMQYTGFKDSTEQEIYEGDIIEYDLTSEDETAGKELGVVKFVDGEWVTQTGNNQVNSLFEELQEEDWKSKVVGNIYQNPDLLNQ